MTHLPLLDIVIVEAINAVIFVMHVIFTMNFIHFSWPFSHLICFMSQLKLVLLQVTLLLT